MNGSNFEIFCIVIQVASNHMHELISLTDPPPWDYPIVCVHHHLDPKAVKGDPGLIQISELLSCIHLHHLPHSCLCQGSQSPSLDFFKDNKASRVIK